MHLLSLLVIHKCSIKLKYLYSRQTDHNWTDLITNWIHQPELGDVEHFGVFSPQSSSLSWSSSWLWGVERAEPVSLASSLLSSLSLTANCTRACLLPLHNTVTTCSHVYNHCSTQSHSLQTVHRPAFSLYTVQSPLTLIMNTCIQQSPLTLIMNRCIQQYSHHSHYLWTHVYNNTVTTRNRSVHMYQTEICNTWQLICDQDVELNTHS